MANSDDKNKGVGFGFLIPVEPALRRSDFPASAVKCVYR